MSTDNNNYGRTRPADDSSTDEEPDSTPAQSSGVRYRSRVEEYAEKADWPIEPLYNLGEVVYLAIAGQQQPAGPFVIVSINDQNASYIIKRQDNGQRHPTAVAERDLRVPA